MIEIKKIKLDTDALDRFAAGLNVSTDRALHAVALQAEGHAKNAAPVLTGALRGSINTQQIRIGTYWVQDGVEYGIFQELGTSKMAAHPFMVPAVENAIRDIAEAVKREYEK